MTRYYAHPDGSAFAAMPDETSDLFPLPEGMVEVGRDEYEQGLSALRQAADEESAAFLREQRIPQVEAARRLVELGLTVEQAAAVSRVPVVELQNDTADS